MATFHVLSFSVCCRYSVVTYHNEIIVHGVPIKQKQSPSKNYVFQHR